MASPSDSKEKIAEVEANIRAVGVKQERVEAALEGSGLYLGTTDHVRQGVVFYVVWHLIPSSTI